MKKIVVLFMLLVVIFVTFAFSTQVAEAGKTGAYIKGLSHIRVGKAYNYTLGCKDLRTTYMEVSSTVKILNPEIVIGYGNLLYNPEIYPGWLAWTGEQDNNLKVQFSVQPEFSGTFSISLECWGDTGYDTAILEIFVAEKNPKK